MILTTTPSVEGRTISEYKCVVFGEVVSGVNFFRAFTWFLVTAILFNVAIGCGTQKRVSGTPVIDRIQERGTLLVGTTGDYRPLSYKEPETGEYWGFGIDVAGEIAKEIGVSISYVPTSWPTLSADVMITEITEAPWYVQNDSRLAAPLLESPFTRGQIGVLMRKGQDDLLKKVNSKIREMKASGRLKELHDKYDLIYGY